MSSVPNSNFPETYITPEEYLAMERAARTRSEYFRGETFALSGASWAHNLISTNLVSALVPRVRPKGCKVSASDLRVKIQALGKYTYPDIAVTCGDEQFEDSFVDTLLNPVVLVEILSESTEKCDRGRKFDHYRELESLRVYALVAQDEIRIEVFTRQEGGFWRYEAWSGQQAIARIEVPRVDLPLAEVYEGVLGRMAGAPSGRSG